MADLDIHRSCTLVRLLIPDQESFECITELDEFVLSIVEGGLLEREVEGREGKGGMRRMSRRKPVLLGRSRSSRSRDRGRVRSSRRKLSFRKRGSGA